MARNKTEIKAIQLADAARKALEAQKAADEIENTAKRGAHLHDSAREVRSDSLRAEQELSTREAKQRDNNMFPKGVASDHGKGNVSN